MSEHPAADPLAEVFPGTADAPLPRWELAPGNTPWPRLLPAWTDQRWAPRPPVPAEPKDGVW